MAAQDTRDQPEDGAIVAPPLEVYYMEVTQPLVDARLGKKSPGAIVAVDRGKATRWLTVGIATQTTQGAFDEQQDRKLQKVNRRQQAFQQISDGHAMWDVSTYRDVLTAPEKGLRMAFERGIPLVNVHMLRDEDGDPLMPDADIEEILDARQYLHADLVAPLAAHDRSSVMGGGSPYGSNLPTGPMPLSPRHRQIAENIAAQDRFAAIPESLRLDREQDGERLPDESGGRSFGTNRAAMRRAVSLQGNQAPATGGLREPDSVPPPPPPPTPGGIPRGSVRAGSVSPEAQQQASVYDVPPPRQAEGSQIGNGPDEDDEDMAPPPPNRGNNKPKGR